MRTAIIGLLFLGVAGFAAEPTDDELKAQALKLNKEATNEDAANEKLKALNKDKANTPRLVKIAAKLQKDSKADDRPFRFYSALVLAKAAQNCKEYDAAETFYQFCFENATKDLQSGKLIVLAGTSLIDFYSTRKQYEKVIKTCEKFLDLPDDAVQTDSIVLYATEKRLRSMALNGDDAGAIEQIDKLMKPRRLNALTKLQLMMIKASVYRDANKFTDAIAVYKECLESIDGNEAFTDEGKKILKARFNYLLVGLYTETDKIDLAIKELEKLVEEFPDNPTYKNDLGFTMADHDRDLDKAEKLIQDAVEMDLKARKKAVDEGKLDAALAKKANPAYIDSLGWVLFKKKKYDESLKNLLESAGDDDESQSIEIWDHVGDCYAAMDKKKEALEAYQKGLKCEDNSKKDADRRRKVTEKINRLKKELK